MFNRGTLTDQAINNFHADFVQPIKGTHESVAVFSAQSNAANFARDLKHTRSLIGVKQVKNTFYVIF
jgi:hypothetical protein